MQNSKLIRKRRGRGGRRGFTLMEILIVLAILAVIIGLVLPNLLGQQKQANIKAAKLQVSAVEDALKIYAAGHDADFPGSLDALINKPAGDDRWSGPYLEKGKTPLDPWGNPIQYQYPGQHSQDRPDVWSMGPDKQSGTADDITNWAP
jgi:general secretion pathway protein G